ncbi:hypothetical protein HELRODRAFT_165341 [Helobdella robusta]|uniref:EGF-like domain-containing protein n=1 Tax=Helobdella robusta TaxID=6412 RepID=T1EWM1_HELRO|nr:hypothetical protein HELRODRAFT_165341 [Helobdella robusta]ESN91327.1 hypothetical protein HELRODRAFT_165341 [Helobdella robusta]
MNSWYRVSVSKLQTVLMMKINNQLPYNKREPSTLQLINSIKTIYLGFPPYLSSRRKRIGLGSGSIQGCIKSFSMNSSRLFVDYKLHDERGATDIKERHLIDVCKQSACSKFPCEHAGQCNDINDGLSFRCVCKAGYSVLISAIQEFYSST